MTRRARQIPRAIHKIRAYIYQACQKLRRGSRREQPISDMAEEEQAKGNPYLHQLRKLLEQVLEQYGREYRHFSPLLIDTDTPPESLLDEDDVGLVLEQISHDLNFIKIATDRPAYFAPYIERMYEDTGLVVQVTPKGQASLSGVNAVLDMEWQGRCHREYMVEPILYLPIYKRPWIKMEFEQNLDISIPIGYNTVIVKG